MFQQTPSIIMGDRHYEYSVVKREVYAVPTCGLGGRRWLVEVVLGLFTVRLLVLGFGREGVLESDNRWRRDRKSVV